MAKERMVKTSDGTKIPFLSQGAAWERKANEAARLWVEIVACKHCGAPNVEGYVCTRCGVDK